MSAASESSVATEFRPFLGLHIEEHGCYHKKAKLFRPCFRWFRTKSQPSVARKEHRLADCTTVAEQSAVDSASQHRSAPQAHPALAATPGTVPAISISILSAARVQAFYVFGHETSVRFQANFYNAFNKTNLAPILFGPQNATVENSLLGLSPAADGGVIDFFLRVDV
jgi:hypothetical protein